uniref:Protein trunk n=1 Tax=Syphacia muris TaxID=451379 RepID=A0A0N5A7L5_9BILA
MASAAVHDRHSGRTIGDTPSRNRRSFESTEECLYRRKNEDIGHHKTFTEWFHFKNSSHYLPFLPVYPTTLRSFNNGEFVNDEPLTEPSGNECRYNPKDVVAETSPTHDRALCQYRYYLDYDPKRIPSTLPSVKCNCDRFYLDAKISFQCEEEHYDVRVLVFDESCKRAKIKWHRIAVGCAPVYTPGGRSLSGTTRTQVMFDINENKDTK